MLTWVQTAMMEGDAKSVELFQNIVSKRSVPKLSTILQSIGDEVWEVWFAHWASMSAVEEKYERPVWAFPCVPAQEAKDQEASNKEPDRSAELAAVAKVQVSHQLNRTGRKKCSQNSQGSTC